MLKQKLIGLYAESKVKTVDTAPIIADWNKELRETRVALITTAGVHLRTQPIFQVEEGDFSYRVIPPDARPEELMISHTHYDRTDADQDVNCVFPLHRLHELKNEGIIGSVASFHFGLQGYIPNPQPLIEEVGPSIADQLVADQVDLAILSPGWYICHQSVGLIQRAIEEKGIRTASVTHLPNVTEKVRPPRAMFLRFPLGRSFGGAFQTELQKKILIDLLQYAVTDAVERTQELPYRWKRWMKQMNRLVTRWKTKIVDPL